MNESYHEGALTQQLDHLLELQGRGLKHLQIQFLKIPVLEPFNRGLEL